MENSRKCKLIVTESRSVGAWGQGQRSAMLSLAEEGKSAGTRPGGSLLPRGGQLLSLCTGEHLAVGKMLLAQDEIVWVDLGLLKKAIYL